MLRRFSSTFKKSKGDHHESKENGAQVNSKRHSKLSPIRRKSSSDDEDNNVKRNEVTGLFEKYSQLIHASQRPLPNQNGDGTYLEHDTSTGLFQDLKSMGFKDFGTLKDVMKSQTSGELIDDKTMLMERVIQVMLYAALHCSRILTPSPSACQRSPVSFEKPGRTYECFPRPALEFAATSSTLVSWLTGLFLELRTLRPV